MQVGDRVRLIGLDGPQGTVGEVVKVLTGMGRGMVRVRWMDPIPRTRLHAAACLEVVE